MVKEEKEKKGFWYWIVLVVVILIIWNIFFDSSKDLKDRISELEYKINNLPSNSNNLETFSVEAIGNSNIVCCPAGSVRTGCTMESISSYLYSSVLPIDRGCCEGLKVKNLWAICLTKG